MSIELVDLHKEKDLVCSFEALEIISELQKESELENEFDGTIDRLEADIMRLERELNLTPYNYGIEQGKIVMEQR